MRCVVWGPYTLFISLHPISRLRYCPSSARPNAYDGPHTTDLLITEGCLQIFYFQSDWLAAFRIIALSRMCKFSDPQARQWIQQALYAYWHTSFLITLSVENGVGLISYSSLYTLLRPRCLGPLKTLLKTSSLSQKQDLH